MQTVLPSGPRVDATTKNLTYERVWHLTVGTSAFSCRPHGDGLIKVVGLPSTFNIASSCDLRRECTRRKVSFRNGSDAFTLVGLPDNVIEALKAARSC